MTAAIIIAAALLLALTGGEIGDAMNMAHGQPSAPGRVRFAAGLGAVIGAALVIALWLVFRGGSPAP